MGSLLVTPQCHPPINDAHVLEASAPTGSSRRQATPAAPSPRRAPAVPPWSGPGCPPDGPRLSPRGRALGVPAGLPGLYVHGARGAARDVPIPAETPSSAAARRARTPSPTSGHADLRLPSLRTCPVKIPSPTKRQSFSVGGVTVFSSAEENRPPVTEKVIFTRVLTTTGTSRTFP